MVKVSEDAPARADARGGAARARAPRTRRVPGVCYPPRLYSAGSRTRPDKWSPKRRQPPSRPRTRSSPSTSSVARWTRSTTSATCPSSRTSITYVPCPRRAVAGRPIYGKAIRRNARRVWVVVSGGDCASGARGSPAVMSVERRPPRIRASARPSPRIAIRAYTLCAPDAALLPPPPPIRLVLLPLEGAPRAPAEITRPNFIIHSPRRRRSDSPRPFPSLSRRNRASHPHGLPVAAAGIIAQENAGDARHRHPPG